MFVTYRGQFEDLIGALDHRLHGLEQLRRQLESKIRVLEQENMNLKERLQGLEGTLTL
jgi:predicted nuclease with TOPRIM domain